MSRSRTLWMALGVVATACSPMDTYPAELADGAAPAPEESTGEGASSPAQQPALSTSSPDGGRAPDAGSTSTSPPLDDTQACIVTGSAGSASEEVPTWRETWDETTRVRTRYMPATPDGQKSLAWRYDAEGRVLTYIGFGSAFQHDYQYDEHGNVKDFRLSYPQPDLFMRYSGDPWMGTSYANEYSASGVLLASTVTPYGEGNASARAVRKTFVQDEQGRCLRVETKGGYADTVEARDYDAASRLSTVHMESSGSVAHNFACNASTETHAYDAAGRVERVTRRCDGGPGAPTIWMQTHAYADDGAVTIETFNFDTDVGDPNVGTIEKRSPGCAAMDAEITRTDTACRSL
jgi:hypothetical protein